MARKNTQIKLKTIKVEHVERNEEHNLPFQINQNQLKLNTKNASTNTCVAPAITSTH